MIVIVFDKIIIRIMSPDNHHDNVQLRVRPPVLPKPQQPHQALTVSLAASDHQHDDDMRRKTIYNRKVLSECLSVSICHVFA